jgi:hypothetical protein
LRCLFPSTQPSWGVLYGELCSELLALFLGNHPNASYVLHKLWSVNRTLVMRGMVESYNKDAYCLSRLLDVAHDIKVRSPPFLVSYANIKVLF